MADTYGLLDFPVSIFAAGKTATDPALDIILAFAQAVLNGEVSAAWQAVAPGRRPVVETFAHNPEDGEFVDSKLPALFAWRRGSGPIEDLADEWHAEANTIALRWVIEPTAQQRQVLRYPAVNAMTKALDRALDNGRSEHWIVDSDRADTDGIKLAFASSTSAQTYSGASLDGVLAGLTFDPPRKVTITRASATGAYATTDITVTGTDKNEDALAPTLTPTTANGGDVLSSRGWQRFRTITSLDFLGQVSTAGSFTVGVGPSDEDLLTRGSLLLRHAGLITCELTKSATPKMLAIQMGEGERPTTYWAVDFELTVQERLVRDPAAYGVLGSGGSGSLYLDTLLSDGTTFGSTQVD